MLWVLNKQNQCLLLTSFVCWRWLTHIWKVVDVQKLQSSLNKIFNLFWQEMILNQNFNCFAFPCALLFDVWLYLVPKFTIQLVQDSVRLFFLTPCNEVLCWHFSSHYRHDDEYKNDFLSSLASSLPLSFLDLCSFPTSSCCVGERRANFDPFSWSHSWYPIPFHCFFLATPYFMFRICKPLFFCFHTGLFINIMCLFFSFQWIREHPKICDFVGFTFFDIQPFQTTNSLS